MNAFQEVQKKLCLNPDGDFGKKSFTAISEYLSITDPIKAVHFFAQCSHETNDFKAFEENLNYSQSGLLKIFGKYFNATQAKEFERNPERIANKVYSNRIGNGDEQSGDGWKYRGRGALQLTGKANYQAFADYVNDPSIMECPEKLLSPEYLFKSAIFFFDKNNLWKLCIDFSEDTIKVLTRRINGGFNGLSHRIELTNKYKAYI
jgi:putative chitinase